MAALTVPIDYLKPGLTELVFTADEAAAIVTALASNDPWDEDAQGCNIIKGHLQSVKRKIKQHHLERQDFDCAYCKVSLTGRTGLSTDREHVLPKSKYKQHTYRAVNLTVACKRCNMEIKKDSLKFVINLTDGQHMEDSANFRIVHPNFDNWYVHLGIVSMRVDRQKLLKYILNPYSNKAMYTYNYFKLKDLEIASFDDAQGVPDAGAPPLRSLFERNGLPAPPNLP
jgi:hypothetical protein